MNKEQELRLANKIQKFLQDNLEEINIALASLLDSQHKLDSLIDYLELKVTEESHGSLIPIKHYTFKKEKK